MAKVKEGKVTSKSRVKDVVSWTGKKIHLDKLDMWIPTLYDFNDEGLIINPDYTWGGSIQGGYYDNLYKFDEMMYEIDAKLKQEGVIPYGKNGYFRGTHMVTWAWEDLLMQLSRTAQDDGQHYIFSIPLRDDKVQREYQWEIITAMCSLISSTPEELSDLIRRDMLNPRDTISSTQWNYIGDCKIILHPLYVSDYVGEDGKRYKDLAIYYIEPLP